MPSPPLSLDAIQSVNRDAWNARVRRKDVFTRPATDEELAAPLKHLDPRGWFGPSVTERRVLCLGAGGGRHGPLLAKAGAHVTVVDLSEEMLGLDREMAALHGLSLRTVQTSIDHLTQLAPSSFDLVVQPVSSCYVPSVVRVYQEVARVLSPGGIYVSQHKSPMSLQCSTRFAHGGYAVETAYYANGPLPATPPSRFREQGTLEFLHRWEDLVGGLCRNGFTLDDLVEVRRGDEFAPTDSFEHRCHFIAPYVRLRARRTPGLVL